MADTNRAQAKGGKKGGKKKYLSIILPVYNEEENIELQYEHLVLDRLFQETQHFTCQNEDHDFSDHNLEIYCNITTNCSDIREKIKRFYHE